MDRKESLVGIGLTATLMALTSWLLFKDQPVTQLLHTLGRFRSDWLLLGLVLMLVFVGCEATYSHLILGRLGHRAPFCRCLGCSSVGSCVSSITPSAAGRQPAQIYHMSGGGVSVVHETLNMMLITVCHQVVVIGYVPAVAPPRFDLVASLRSGPGLLLLFGAVVNGALTAGILCPMFLPNAARRLTGSVLNLLVRVRLARCLEKAREKLGKQMEEYRRGTDYVRRNPALVPALLDPTFCQLTTLFFIPLVVYCAFSLTGSGALDIIGTQTLVTLAVASLPLLGMMGASKDGFVVAMELLFGAGLMTPAVLVSRDISFYPFLLLNGYVTLLVHLRARNRQPITVSPRLPKTARGTVVTRAPLFLLCGGPSCIIM